jgi:hypothetical protein
VYALRPAPGLGAKVEAGAVGAGVVTGAAAGASLGPIGAIVGAVVGGVTAAFSSASAARAADKAEQAYDEAVQRAIEKARRERMAAQAGAYSFGATTEQGKTIQRILFGTGGVLLAGAGVLWLISRKDK